ncbi:acetylpolyamine aminohydrolase [Legionella rubrilucens]|uniref:Acetylpolyamine aminohydrolase n=1 Tax=Legionella rubrilucens TaxID=458 RepID=A0A0W0Y1N6_9GAMM|nr:hypothetical protein [Legionella rubrilucens]KTD50550.1 acetylpolyamine aminohydrolase [Legionella rubrilucens]
MKFEELLYQFKTNAVLDEKQRLSQWAYRFRDHNPAFLQGLKACSQHLDEIKSSSFFTGLDNDSQYTLLRQIKTMEQLTQQVIELQLVKKDLPPAIVYQVPAYDELLAMRGMYAGGKQDQLARLLKLVKTLKTQLKPQQITETMSPFSHHWIDRLPWRVLCQAIRSRNAKLAKAAFEAIADDNPVLKALLKVHDKDYLLSLIETCAALAPGKVKEIDTDILCGHLTFEVLIHELLTTLEQRQQFNFCLGLPTHHAYRERGAGFCLLNKLAVVMAYEELTADVPFHAVVIGTDINRDDGLNSVLMAETTTQAFTHIDIHDSRVYPWQDESVLRERMGAPIEEKDWVWQKGNKCYHSVDLASCSRQRRGCHAALHYALEELDRLLGNAAKKKEKIMLFLPTGWDSHEKEEAPCGKEINQDYTLGSKESHSRRFSDEDLLYFTQKIVDLIKQYPDVLCRVYWQLEGGYTEHVNVQQLKNTVNILNDAYPQAEEVLEDSKALVY